ncbi:MAG: iron dependent repressor, metal binding and dimerization domain protein, partial [Chlamydiota bacterium]|nr:iron dependent repressor, metal binding and dimerization domain protein [Chlamydiota bacterium]
WRRWLDREGKLTPSGRLRGAHLVRLHRLWELYLVRTMGLSNGREHKSAEEIEHLLTPELEADLESILEDAQYDPHGAYIPTKEDTPA